MAWLKACDFSYDKPNLPQLWVSGYRVILMYLSNSGKGFTDSYAKQALDIGFKILPLYETTAGAALGGYSTGVTHAKFAKAKAASQGIPPEVPIIYALDQDFSTAQLAGPVTQYVNGLNSVNPNSCVYGGYNQIKYLHDHGVLKGVQNFQTYAWSGGKWLPTSYAPIQQYHNGVSVAGGIVDNSRADDSIIFWENSMSAADVADLKKYIDAMEARVNAKFDALPKGIWNFDPEDSTGVQCPPAQPDSVPSGGKNITVRPSWALGAIAKKVADGQPL